MRTYFTGFISVLMLFGLVSVSPSQADVDWQITKAFKLDSAPLDIASSADGSRVFVLAEGGKLLVYADDGGLIDSVPVDPSMDKLSVSGEITSPLENTVYLSSKSKNTAQQIVIAFQADIDISGSPFLGAPDAPVAIVVFSDFQ